MSALRLVLVPLFVLSACSGPPTSESSEWCQTHQAEVLLADASDTQEEVNQRIANASLARIASRIRGESEILGQTHSPLADASTRLNGVRELESYAEEMESGFVDIDTDDWNQLASDEPRYQAACSSAFTAHQLYLDSLAPDQ